MATRRTSWKSRSCEQCTETYAEISMRLGAGGLLCARSTVRKRINFIIPARNVKDFMNYALEIQFYDTCTIFYLTTKLSTFL